MMYLICFYLNQITDGEQFQTTFSESFIPFKWGLIPDREKRKLEKVLELYINMSWIIFEFIRLVLSSTIERRLLT